MVPTTPKPTRSRATSTTTAQGRSEAAKPPTIDLLTPTVAQWEVSSLSPAGTLADHDATATTLVVCARPATPEGGAVEALIGLDPLEDLGVDVEDLVATFEPDPAAGACTTVPWRPGERPARSLRVIGLGAGGLAGMRAAGGVLGRGTRGQDDVVLLAPSGWTEAELAALVESAVLAGWGPPRWTSDGVTAPVRPAARVTVVTAVEGAETVVRHAVTRATATLRARCLGATPSNIKNPAWMVAQARTLARRHGLSIEVWSDKDLVKGGFGGLVAVGGGSATPPRMVRLDHVPEGATSSTPHIVLVGKGITFDTGGLNVKPAEGMLAMKTDMMGSAAVLAVLAACRDLGVAVRVTGLLALAENAVSGASYRPGDVITHYGGTTVEIGNTDAEGRIVLADALAYAAREIRPDLIVDIATLTGAARVALARAMAPVYATDEAVRDALVAASETVGETLWPFPLPDAYRPELDSDVADLKQFTSSVGGGSIMAALFLKDFVGETPWAHLDIAGPGRSDVDAGVLSKGPTGFGTRLLLRWLEGLR
jgi:leucyl aminopeptidase